MINNGGGSLRKHHIHMINTASATKDKTQMVIKTISEGEKPLNKV
jgi:hypothetical protein